MLLILDTQVATAEENMRFDQKLLNDLDSSGSPILHLYRWANPSATYGHFTKPEQFLDLLSAQSGGLSLAKRPTGGGIIFHIWDFAFSFLMPSAHPKCSLNTLTNYEFVNRTVLEVMGEFIGEESLQLIPESIPSLGPHCVNFCMAKPTQYDVVYRGRKIAGAAQRRTKKGYLHQGTISLAFPDLEFLSAVLIPKEEIIAAMTAHTFAPLGKGWTQKDLEEARDHIQKKLTENFMEKLSLST